MPGGFDAGKVKGGIVFDTGQFKRAATLVKGSQKQMAGQAKKTGTAFGGMWKQVAAGFGITQIVASGIRLITRQMTDTIQKGRAFEKAWANVTTMLSVSKKQTEEMRKELLKISPTLGSTTDLAKGMYQVLSASIEPAKAIKFLGEAAKSAKAGVTDTATAVDALTTVINAYGMEAERVTDVSDIMFQTVKRGKLTYEGMAGALGTVVPIAAQIGVKFEEVAAAMATLTRQGVDVNTTTVQLRQVMVSVLKPTVQAQEAAEELGLDFNAAALRAKGLAGFLKDVKEKAGGDAEALTALFGNVRALTGVMGLAGEAAGEFTYDLELMGKAAGSTEEAFRKQMDSLDFWIETLTNSIDKFKISFYEGFADPIKAGIASSRELESEVKDLMGVFRDLGKITGTVVKVAFGDLVEKWKENKRIATAINIVFEGMKLAIEKGQIPSLKNAAKAWKEHYNALADNERKLKRMQDPYVGLSGFIAKQVDLVKEHVRWILEDSKSAKESIRRLEEYKQKLKDSNVPLGNANRLLKTKLKSINAVITGTHAWNIELIDTKEVLKNAVKEMKPAVIHLKALDLTLKEIMAKKFAIAWPDFQLGEQKFESFADFYKAWLKGLEEEWQNSWQNQMNWASFFTDQLGTIFSQLSENQAIRLENEEQQHTDALEDWYAREQERIEKAITNEEERVAALEALDEEKARKENALQVKMDKERRKAARSQAKMQKVTNLMAAIVNTARAITEALPNIPLSIAVGIMGAIQVATIAAQPLPSFQEGGPVEKEMIARLHPGEYVVSAKEMREAKDGIRTSEMTLYQTVNIYAQTLDDGTVDHAAERIFDAVEREKRRRGF